jgi:hypothetical protein
MYDKIYEYLAKKLKKVRGGHIPEEPKFLQRAIDFRGPFIMYSACLWTSFLLLRPLYIERFAYYCVFFILRHLRHSAILKKGSPQQVTHFSLTDTLGFTSHSKDEAKVTSEVVHDGYRTHDVRITSPTRRPSDEAM